MKVTAVYRTYLKFKRYVPAVRRVPMMCLAKTAATNAT
jgi:hypothetical protein